MKKPPLQPTELKATKLKLPPIKTDAPLHALLGVSTEFTRGELMFVVNQRDDLTNKLKAMKPLLKDIGIDLDMSDQKNNTQINIITSPTSASALSGSIYEVTPPRAIANKETIVLGANNDE